MRTAFAILAGFLLCGAKASLDARTTSAKITGRVIVNGTVPKLKPIDISKDPLCAQLHAAQHLLPDTVLTGPGNSLRNVVVYISRGAPAPSPVPSAPVTFDQLDCHYSTHILAFRAGQEVKISNSDPLSHNIHPLAKVNREWNKIQLPGTPPFSYTYDNEEFIPVKCNLHPWMQGYFVVLKTSFFAVTGDDGRFEIPDLPPGHYTLTAWHESLGTQTAEIDVPASGDAQTVNFTFSAKP